MREKTKSPEEIARSKVKNLVLNAKSNYNQEKRLDLGKQICNSLKLLAPDIVTGMLGGGIHQDPTELATPLFECLFGNPIKEVSTLKPDNTDIFKESFTTEYHPVVIQIDTPTNDSDISELFSGLQEPEKMAGENKVSFSYKDGSGEGLGTGTKKLDYQIPQEIDEISFHIKRYESGKGLSTAQTVRNKVNYNPIIINHKTYQPTAFICHYGSLNAGHYVAYIKDNKNHWYLYDDSKEPQLVDEETVMQNAAESGYLVKYSSNEAQLPDHQKFGTPNIGATCWFNSLLAFTLSLTTIQRTLEDKKLEDKKPSIPAPKNPTLYPKSEDLNFKVVPIRPSSSPRDTSTKCIAKAVRKDKEIDIVGIKEGESFSGKIEEKKVREMAEIIIKNTFDTLKSSAVRENDINLFVNIMQKLAKDNIINNDTAGSNVGFKAWRDTGKILEELENRNPKIEGKNADEMMQKFKAISTEMQKQAKDYFDTTPGRKYKKDTSGARSYRIVQLLPDGYDLKKNVSPSR